VIKTPGEAEQVPMEPTTEDDQPVWKREIF
jgi:hypothetical protein